MATEIERRFLVMNDGWRKHADVATPILQAYIAVEGSTVVRLRIAGESATMTIKSVADERDLRTRREYECPVPRADAQAMLEDLQPQRIIRKARYRVTHEQHTWEVDDFEDANSGLVIAEVELRSVDELVSLPPWIGVEISNDRRYLNVELATRPISTW